MICEHGQWADGSACPICEKRTPTVATTTLTVGAPDHPAAIQAAWQRVEDMHEYVNRRVERHDSVEALFDCIDDLRAARRAAQQAGYREVWKKPEKCPKCRGTRIEDRGDYPSGTCSMCNGRGWVP